MTTGSAAKSRKITDGVLEDEYYPNHEAVDFYGHYKEDIKLLLKWDLNVFVHL